MKTIINKETEKNKKFQKDIEGDEHLFFFLYKKINIFYEFDENKYGEIFYKSIYNFESLKKKYEENKKYSENIKNIEKQNIKIIGVGGYGQVYKLDENFCIKISLTNKNYYHEYFIAKELSTNNNIKNSIIEPKLLIKKNNFSGLINFFNINILFIYLTYCFTTKKKINESEIKSKIISYDIKNEFKYLFRNENRSIVSEATLFFNFLFFYFFKDNFFINMVSKFIKILNYFKEYLKLDEKKGYLMVMPLADMISTSIYLNKDTLKLDSYGLKAIYVYPYIYRMLFLQVSLFLLNTKENYSYTHNDLKPDNILVCEELNPYSITYNDLTFYFKEKFIFKIADFDFSKLLDIKKIDNINENTKNKKIEKTKFDSDKNWFFDIHFFIHKLLYYIGEDETDIDKDFFLNLYNLFIEPYCKVTFTDLHSCIKVNIKKTNDVCDKGYFFSEKKPDVSILINFLKSNFFTEWIKK